MNKLESLKNEYLQLCEEFEKASNYMHSIGKKRRCKKREIEELESRTWFKYNGKTYRVCYEELKYRKSILLKDIKNGNLVIIIDNKLTPKERQEELHIMLKEKKCLKHH